MTANVIDDSVDQKLKETSFAIKKAIYAVTQLKGSDEHVMELKPYECTHIDVGPNLPYPIKICLFEMKPPLILNLHYATEGDLNIYGSFINAQPSHKHN